MTPPPGNSSQGFIEMALVLILIGIVVVVIFALLGPEITAFLERIQLYFAGTS